MAGSNTRVNAMLFFICVIAVILDNYNNKQRQREAERQRLERLRMAQYIIETQEERERQEKINKINEELNALYYKRDLLMELQTMQEDAPKTETNLKKAIATETSLQAVNKRIYALECKIDKM